MPKPPAQKATVEIKLDLSHGRFETVLYFTHFGVVTLEGHKLVHFAFQSGQLSTSWSCLFDGDMLASHKLDWLRYAKEIGLPNEELPEHKWRPEAIQAAPIANFVAWSRRGEQAEIRCFSFSFGDISVRLRENSKPPLNVMTKGLALLRCSVDTQRQLLLALYSDLF